MDSTPEDPPPARDAEDPGTQLETVVVTADKREKPLGNTAGSVAVVTGENLEALGARDSEDLLKLVPGLSLNKENADRSDPSIRGIASETRFQTTQRATGIYIDEIPMSDPFIPISQPDVSPFDLERVEILEGPQGTLFGSTALAGAIRYITRKPEIGAWRGRVRGSLSQVADGNRRPDGAGMLNAPLGDSAALRGVYVYRSDPGYIDDTRSGARDVGAIEQRHGRIEAAWRATDALDLSATYLEQTSRQDDAPYADQRQARSHGNSNAPNPTSSAFDVGNLVASYDFSWARLLSSTSRRSKEAHLRLDVARVLGADQAGQPVITTADTTSHGITQELRLGSHGGGAWDWTAGAWYLHDSQSYVQYVPNPALHTLPLPALVALPPLALPVLGNVNLANDAELGYAEFHTRGTELALFGDVTRRLGEHWEVTAGGRFYRTRLHSHNVASGLLTAGTSGSPEQVNDGDLEERGFNPRASITFRFDEAAMVYALASKGFRFGGVQLAPPNAIDTLAGPAPGKTFKSDRLWNYEVGARTGWFKQRLQVNATLFYEKWKDLQITRVGASGLFTYVQNIGAAHTEGAQLSIEALPWPGLTASTAAAYIDARTDEPFDTADGTVPEHTRLPGTPHFQVASQVAYEHPFGRWRPGLRVVHSRIGQSPNNLFATDRIGGYQTVDVHAHLAMLALPGHPDLALAVTNAGDSQGVAGVYADPSSMARDYYFVTPRTFTATLGFSF